MFHFRLLSIILSLNVTNYKFDALHHSFQVCLFFSGELSILVAAVAGVETFVDLVELLDPVIGLFSCEGKGVKHFHFNYY